ncbi:hypothetical protein [Sphingopyxis sp. PET50]|uniref:hypothetical protein n=1 Tax=Sphingopyxis sp. PET50 TaxID=2976533 RepID=UPI0021AFDBA3|nr:hypothetical protein [Sphingopyxis sp. PET50]
MNRLERTYALFGGLLAMILFAGAADEADLTRLTASFSIIAALFAGAIIVENRDAA